MESIGAFMQWHGTPGVVWPELLANAGYISVEHQQGLWQNVHDWCKEVIGYEHYSWTGSTFWFETKEHALMFKLCWG
jgi:hypothetical protein